MAQTLTQAQRRRPQKLFDQHGRKWHTTLDIVANGPCAPINPDGWGAPLLPPQKYVKFQSENGMPSVTIDYDFWIAELTEAHKTYDQKLYDDALLLFGEGGPKHYEERSPALLRYTGLPPQPIEPVKAAKQGNKWVLGLTEKPDPRLTPFFVVEKVAEPDYGTDWTEEDEVEQPRRAGRPPKAEARN